MAINILKSCKSVFAYVKNRSSSSHIRSSIPWRPPLAEILDPRLVTDLKWPHGTEWQCGNSTLAMSWPNHVQILSFVSMASRQGAVKHGFVSTIAGGCASYDVIAPWPDRTWSIFFYQKLRKVCPIRYPKTRRRVAPPFFPYLRNLRGGGVHQPPPRPGEG